MIGNTLKKSICVFMAVIALTACIFMPVVSADSATEDIAYLNKVSLLEKLGILTANDTMQYSRETITRENYAAMLGVFYDISRFQTDFSDGQGIFSDVSSKNPSCELIEAVVGAGAMEGYKDGKFRPTMDLTVEQAAKSILVLLGYDSLVIAKGQGDRGYINQARELDLLDGINKSNTQAITKGELVEMLCTALDTEVLQLSSLGDKVTYETKRNETLLSEYFGVYKLEGILQATDITGIGRIDSVRSGYIVVNGNMIKTNEDMNMYLGLNLNVYCTHDENKELVMMYYFEKENKNLSLTISAEDIHSVDNKTISYELNGKEKKIKLPGDVTVIFNGKNYPLYTDDTFRIQEGSIKFIDADNNGNYETVYIKSYISIWVGQVFDDNGNVVIIDKNNNQNKYYLNINDTDKKIIFKKNNSIVTYKDIKNDDVVLLAADKMNLSTKTVLATSTSYEFLISDKTVNGQLETVNYGETTEFIIDEETYKVTDDFSLSGCDMDVGDSAKFYLDYFGKIVAAEKGISNVYGILDGVAEDSAGWSITSVRIFASDGAFKVFDCAKKIKIDGVEYSIDDVSDIKTALKTSSNKFFTVSNMSKTGASEYFQVVKYSLNSDGEVTLLDTLTENSSVADIEEKYLHFSKKFDTGTKFFGKAYAMTIQGGYTYDSNAVIFRIPSDKSKIKAFSKKSDLFSLGYENLTMPVYAFDADEFNYIPLMLAETDLVEKVPTKEQNNIMIFENLTKELHVDGEAYSVMNGTSVKSGEKIKIFLTDDAYNTFNTFGANPGDVIRWTYDDLNFASTLEHALKYTGNDALLTLGDTTSGINDTGYYADFRLTCGNVENFNNKYILFNLGTVKEASLINPSAKVLVYDSASQKTKPGDYSMIKTKEAFPDDASLVLTLQQYSAINAIVIFN